eukprot:c14961_g1_i2.p1 GENE.c14961_g1_i2~~c14961_g1_i2.p1  ORF type:complete len:626 (-),score=99.01 c14961_g1_i2:1270-3147(-)
MSANDDDLKPLLEAAKSGDTEILSLQLSSFDPSKYESKGHVIFHAAVTGGSLPVARELVSRFGLPVAVTSNGSPHLPPLIAAAQCGHLDIVRYLLDECKTDIEVSTEHNVTALNIASEKGHINIVRYLVQRGANVATRTKTGVMPLSIASHVGHLDTVRLLVEEAHADVNAATDNGMTSLYIAAEKGHINIVRFLVEIGRANVAKATNSGVTPLWVASYNGHVEVVRYLVKAGADVEAVNSHRLSPLWTATQRGHIEVVKCLINEAHASIDSMDFRSRTPLCMAAINGALDIVRFLHSVGANLEASTNKGRTPLLFACHEGHLEVVRYLVLEAKVSVICATHKGRGVVFSACQEGHFQVAKFLVLEAKAPYTTPDYRGLTPLYIAARKGHTEIVKWLVLDMKMNVDVAKEHGETPLCIAAQEGHIDIVRFLTEAPSNANPTVANNLPINIASKRGHLNICKWLAGICGVPREAAIGTAKRRQHDNITNWLNETRDWTKLMVATDMGDVPLVLKRLHSGDDPEFTAASGHTALSVAQALQPSVTRDELIKLIALASEPWSPRSHMLWPNEYRVWVKRSLMIEHRLRMSSTATPKLPQSLFLHMIGLVGRVEFMNELPTAATAERRR